jgi:hypothetical protein
MQSAGGLRDPISLCIVALQRANYLQHAYITDVQRTNDWTSIVFLKPSGTELISLTSYLDIYRGENLEGLLYSAFAEIRLCEDHKHHALQPWDPDCYMVIGDRVLLYWPLHLLAVPHGHC